jgi:multidrug efflux pump subunit AcrA (membrane-fusion protein)
VPPGQVVWVRSDDGKLEPVVVTTGIADDKWTQVTSGLDPGAEVVTAVVRDPDAGATRPQLPSFGSSGSRR